eukprot:gene4337-5925_t
MSLQTLQEDARRKIDEALALKEKGNAFFKNSEYKKAIRQYAMSQSYTKGMPGRGATNSILSAVVAPSMLQNSTAGSVGSLTPELESEINSLEVTVKTNLSACYIKIGDAEKAIKNAKEALALNPQAWKSTIRLAEAQVLAKDYEKAIDTCEKALALIPSLESDPSAKGAKNTVSIIKKNANALLKADEQKQKESFRNIFNK